MCGRSAFMCSEVMDILKVFKIKGYSVGGLKRNRIAYKRCVLQSGPNQSRTRRGRNWARLQVQFKTHRSGPQEEASLNCPHQIVLVCKRVEHSCTKLFSGNLAHRILFVSYTLMNFRRKLFFEGHFKAIIKPEGDATDTQQDIFFLL